MTGTTNNTKALRLALLWTPQQLADRLGVETSRVKRLENDGDTPSAAWAEAIAHAMGVPANAVTNPDADIAAAAASAKPVENEYTVCRIAARYAILAMTAKLGGLKAAQKISNEDLEIAVQNLALYTETDKAANEAADERTSRLSRSLQIVVLAILQSRGADPGPHLAQEMKIALDGTLSLMSAFSRIDQTRRGREKR